MVLMYIYDQSFYLFKDEKNYNSTNSEDNLPLIYGHIPKLYYENCYQVYISLIHELKSTNQPIDLSDKSKFKIRKTRRQLLNEIKSLEKIIYFIVALIIALLAIFAYLSYKNFN